MKLYVANNLESTSTCFFLYGIYHHLINSVETTL